MLVFLGLTFYLQVPAQNAASLNFFNRVRDYDLAAVINPDSISDSEMKFKHYDPLGFIDTDYQRFYIHISSIVRSKTDPFNYIVKGKTKVKNNICNFDGTFRMIEAGPNNTNIDDATKWLSGYIICSVLINENKREAESGSISGKLETDFVIDGKGNIQYDALNLVANGYSNNQFEGTWTSYTTGKTKKCNWGDGRIPDSGKLDVGAGQFVPNEKYLDRGWRDYFYMQIGFIDDPKRKAAAEREEMKWWE